MRLGLLILGCALSVACAQRAAEQPATTSTAPAAPAPSTEPAPPQDPEKWSLNVRPIMAGGGITEPEHLEDWDNAKRLAPGSQVFKNLELLGEDRADTVVAAMQSMKPSVGMGCKACHVKDDYASDEKEDKLAARAMIEMAAAINSHYFEGKTQVSCFTCHKGKDHPENELPKDAVAAKPKSRVRQLTAAQASQPAEKVYKNIEMMKGMEARHVLGVMDNFTIALGVSCEFCHAENGDWADDSNKHKKIARGMSKMTQELDAKFFKGEGELSCWTCHGGKKEPAIRAAQGT